MVNRSQTGLGFKKGPFGHLLGFYVHHVLQPPSPHPHSGSNNYPSSENQSGSKKMMGNPPNTLEAQRGYANVTRQGPNGGLKTELASPFLLRSWFQSREMLVKSFLIHIFSGTCLGEKQCADSPNPLSAPRNHKPICEGTRPTTIRVKRSLADWCCARPGRLRDFLQLSGLLCFWC